MSVALAFALACNSKPGSGGSGNPGTVGTTGPASGASAAADVVIDAKALLKEYKDNEVAADQKYKGKVLQITGVVGDIKKDFMDQIYVTVGTGAAFELPMAQCFFDDSATAKAATLKKGDKVTIKGRVDGLMLNVLVKDSVFVP
jgi:hypothetical protein